MQILEHPNYVLDRIVKSKTRENCLCLWWNYANNSLPNEPLNFVFKWDRLEMQTESSCLFCCVGNKYSLRQSLGNRHATHWKRDISWKGYEFRFFSCNFSNYFARNGLNEHYPFFCRFLQISSIWRAPEMRKLLKTWAVITGDMSREPYTSLKFLHKSHIFALRRNMKQVDDYYRDKSFCSFSKDLGYLWGAEGE